MTEKPFLLLPNDLRQEIVLMQNLLIGLRADIINSDATDKLKDDFESFAKEWDDYRNSLSGVKSSEGFTVWDYLGLTAVPPFAVVPMTVMMADKLIPEGLKLMVTSSWTKIQQFQFRAEQWRLIAKSAGVKTSTTNTVIRDDLDKRATFRIPWWVWPIGGAVLIYNMSPLKTAHSIRSLIPSRKKH
jgi:hypothetical protein